MKNKLLLGALLICIAGIFTSCEDDRDDNPTFITPTSFTLNTPAMTDQYIQLSATNTVHLTWSQPNFGYNAYATYSIQVGVVQADGGITWCQKNVKDGNGNVIGREDDYLSTNLYTCSSDINGEEIAQCINQADGITKPEDYVDKGFRKIAFRVRAALFEALTDLVPGSTIISNTVFFNYMAAYEAIKAPAYIYLVGSPNDWIAPQPANAAALEPWKLIETEIGSKVFEGTFVIPAGDLQFRFYTYLDDWGSDDDPMGSVGPQAKDAPISGCEWDEKNSYSDDLLQPGKGTWKFAGFAGGSVTFTVDMNTNKVKFTVN
ncbi:SusE domain-containing protein [Prevotella sp. E13-27]|uniref:SusE domain-containing protein n=1 Tax=Prevotella sp. E13-27 TaxID=2938122 RepID=UPI00200B2DC3|nr:SusE domain-containing protein [Prevotella sp. E13-27]MCK8621707.1 SusE domain-containing protein [Prevotella sp. E13-27]